MKGSCRWFLLVENVFYFAALDVVYMSLRLIGEVSRSMKLFSSLFGSWKHISVSHITILKQSHSNQKDLLMRYAPVSLHKIISEVSRSCLTQIRFHSSNHNMQSFSVTTMPLIQQSLVYWSLTNFPGDNLIQESKPISAFPIESLTPLMRISYTDWCLCNVW